jgi:predicted transcriptional regulator YdeE
MRILEPDIIDREAFKVAGVITRIKRGTETPELFARIWSTFESNRGEIAPHSIDKSYFGVSFPTADRELTDYLAGMMVADHTPPLAGCEMRTVAGGTFAVFECPVDGIGTAYQHIFGTWLPGAPFEFEGTSAPFEEYPEDTSNHPVRINIPIKPRVEPREKS